MKRENDPKHLHPDYRKKMEALLDKLSAENLPFRLFEGFRSPQRQKALYAQGRTTGGAIVTKARPWSSYHQYGVAGDFVLYENGNWSWDDKGEKGRWWERLHELAREVGLTPLSWELPHLQLADVTLDSLLAGHYPPNGDRDWAENLEEAIYAWTGTPSPPKIPVIGQDRPPLQPSISSASMIADTPSLGSEDWHSRFDGQEWRYDGAGVYLRAMGDGAQPLRTRGEPVTCRRILDVCGDEIAAASRKYDIPMAIIMMVVATETAFARNQGFTGPQTFRWEPHVKVKDVSPPLLGDYSAGPMQTLATTARWVIREQDLNYDPFKVAPVYERRPEPPEEHPLYDFAANIDIGAAEIKQRWSETEADPVLVAAVFNAGGLYKNAGNPWRLRSTGDHLDRAVRWYGDACATLAELS